MKDPGRCRTEHAREQYGGWIAVYEQTECVGYRLHVPVVSILSAAVSKSIQSVPVVGKLKVYLNALLNHSSGVKWHSQGH